MPSFFFFLLTLGVTLKFSYNSSHGVWAGPTTSPPTPTYHIHPHHHPTPPGSQVVIVVQNDHPSSHSQQHSHAASKLLPTSLPRPSSDRGRKQKRASRKSILIPAGINRQGRLLTKPSIDETPLLKSGKARIAKFIQASASPRHISGIQNDLFPNPIYSNKVGLSLNEKIGNPTLLNFRPHQPDITPINTNSKLPLTVGYSEDALAGMKHINNPNLSANKLNPYTNGVAASFPPGIDPFEGFVRYAAENLDSPVGNVVDYHSLEHYYGPQHPLSPHHNNANAIGKDTSLENHPYADSFAYSGGAPDISNIGGAENRNSLPIPSPPVGTAVTIEGFRARDNPDGNNPGTGIGGSDYNSLIPQEHGIDHFHAPSPGLGSAPPRPRPPTPTDPASYEDDPGARSPPFDSMGSPPPFAGNPYKNSADSDAPPPPPDLRVFEEGPPPELLNARGPPPGMSPMSGPPPPGRGHGPGPDHASPQSSHPGPDADLEQNSPPEGDDAIWGILDLAEMLEKGEIPGQKKANSPTSSSDRVLYPLNGGGGGSGDGGSAATPPVNDHLSASPPHLPYPKFPFQSSSASADNSYEFDDGGAFETGNKRPPFGSNDSQEANEYDDTYAK